MNNDRSCISRRRTETIRIHKNLAVAEMLALFFFLIAYAAVPITVGTGLFFDEFVFESSRTGLAFYAAVFSVAAPTLSLTIFFGVSSIIPVLYMWNLDFFAGIFPVYRSRLSRIGCLLTINQI